MPSRPKKIIYTIKCCRSLKDVVGIKSYSVKIKTFDEVYHDFNQEDKKETESQAKVFASLPSSPQPGRSTSINSPSFPKVWSGESFTWSHEDEYASKFWESFDLITASSSHRLTALLYVCSKSLILCQVNFQNLFCRLTT